MVDNIAMDGGSYTIVSARAKAWPRRPPISDPVSVACPSAFGSGRAASIPSCNT